MPAQVKIDAVAELKGKISEAQSLILADYRGLNVENMTQLRALCDEAEVEIRVVKNRLAKLALKECELPALDDLLVGPTIIAFGVNDPVSPAKVLSKFAKDHEHLNLKGGMFEGRALDLSEVNQLAQMPSREELYGRLAGSLAAPATNIARCVSEVIGGLARVIKAAAEAKA